MGDGDALGFLRSQKVAHVGTVDEAGWPYVIPLIYIYEGDERLYLHTGELVLRSSSRKVRRVGLDVRAGIPIARSDLYEQRMEIVTGKHSEGLHH
jgi:nitroimidazol reductase NimA-like FMN-containing flavoprotein (pyridoxamine 5'-phosphate oxidase superfamily)